MFYVERDAAGAVRSIQKWPTDTAASPERLSLDDPEIVAFRSRHPSRTSGRRELDAAQFVLVLAVLKIKMADLELEIDGAAGLTSAEKAYHKARCRRGDRYPRDDRVLMSALIALGVTDEALDAAWTTAEGMVP